MLSDKSVARFSEVLHSVTTLESQFQPASLCGFLAAETWYCAPGRILNLRIPVASGASRHIS
jgi:hypothetical protein